MGAVPAQGQAPVPGQMMEMSNKSLVTYALLGFFLGNLGVHDFYAGFPGRAIINILGNFLISPFLVQVSTGIELLSNKKDGNGKFMQGSHTAGIILGIILIIGNLIVGLIVAAAVFARMR